jgi:hypothetical protein
MFVLAREPEIHLDGDDKPDLGDLVEHGDRIGFAGYKSSEN